MQSVATASHRIDMMMLPVPSIMQVTGWVTVDPQVRPSLAGCRIVPAPCVRVAPLVLEPLPSPFKESEHQSKNLLIITVNAYLSPLLIIHLRQSS
jgi:hypothetical protein